MEIEAHHEKVLTALKEQMVFLQSQMEEPENAEVGKEELEHLLSALKEATEYLEAHPPAEDEDEDEVEMEVEPAGADEEAEAGPPEDVDDAEGWLSYLAANPGDTEALDNLQRLETKGRLDQDWDTVLTVLMGRLDAVEEQEERLDILKEMGRIYEQEIGDLAKTFDTAQVAHSLNPSDEGLTAEMLRLAEATEQWAQLMEHLNQVIPEVDDPKTRSNLWMRSSRVYSERLNRPDYAIAALGKALEVDSQNAEAWDGLATLYKSNESWHELAQVLRKRLDIADDEERVFYLMELADLHETRMGDQSEARILYEQILEMEPDNAGALASLEGICRSLELWTPLVKVLRRRIEVVEEKAQARELRLEVAELLAGPLEEPQTAVVEYERVLEKHGEDVEVLKKLSEMYEELDQPDAYIKVAERVADLSEDPEEKIALYRRIVVELELRTETRAHAVDFLEKILELDPGDDTVYRSLEKAYIMEEAWDELNSTYRRHVENAVSTSVKVEIHKARASVLDERLEDPKAAVEALELALELDLNDVGTLTSVSGLYRRLEEWVKLVDVLSQRADLMDDDAARVELHRQIGEITATKLGDPESAEKRLMKALELDPDNLGAVTALIGLYKDRKEFLRAAKMIARAEELTTNPLQRARLLYEAAELYRDELKDQEKALEHYRKTLQVDPEYEEAADYLQQYHYEQEEWDDAEPLLDLLVRKADKSDRRRVLRLYTQLGMVARNLKDADKAIKFLDQAREIDPSSLDVLTALADLKYQKEDWKGSANLYQAMLVGHRENLDKEELVRIYHRLGTIKLHSDERDKALNMFEKALEIDPGYEPSAQAVIDLRAESKDYDKVIAAKRSLLDQASDDESRRRQILDIADLYADKMASPEDALDYYGRALEFDDHDHVTLHKVMELHTAAERWDKVAETVLRLEAVEDDSAIKAKYYYAAGVIYRDELKDADSSLEQFEACLELNPGNQGAFDAVERILTERENWKALGRAYRTHYKRLPERTSVTDRVAMLNKMGELYLTQIGEAETAMAAYEAAVALDASDPTRNEILARLYLEAGPDKLDKAIEQHQLLLKSAPYNIPVYKTLCDLYIKTKQKDKTWCLCQALTFMKKHTDKEKLFFERYQPKGFVRARRKLNDELWRDALIHPTENTLLDSILAGICAPAAMMTAQPHKAFNLRRKEKVDPERDEQPFSKLFCYAADALVVNLRPEIFLRPDQLIPIQLANTRERTSLVPSWLVDVGKFQGKSPNEIVFEVARQLSFQRLERYLRRAVPSVNDLVNSLAGAISIMVPEAPLGENPTIKKFAQYLRQSVPPMVFEQLTPHARALVQAGADAVNIPKWLVATELTALRSGLLLCNDFATVARVVAAESDSITGMPAKDRIKQMMTFSVSEEYFQLRDYLGFSVS